MFLRLIFLAVCVTPVLFQLNLAVALCDPGQQTWHLLGEDHNYTGAPAADSTTHLIDCIMAKTLTTEKSYKNVAYNQTMWWYAQNPAQVDLTFNAGGDWNVRIDHEKNSGWTWTANICKVTSTGDVAVFATGMASASNDSSGVTVITCAQNISQTFTVASGDRLALCIQHNDSSQTVRTYFYKESYMSSLTSPETDPAYPVPEEETIILVALGIFILAGYTVFTARNKRRFLFV